MHGKGMNAARQILRRFDRAMRVQMRAASFDCIVRRLYRLGPTLWNSLELKV